MKTSFKKSLALLLVLVICLSMLPLPALADDEAAELTAGNENVVSAAGEIAEEPEPTEEPADEPENEPEAEQEDASGVEQEPAAEAEAPEAPEEEPSSPEDADLPEEPEDGSEAAPDLSECDDADEDTAVEEELPELEQAEANELIYVNPIYASIVSPAEFASAQVCSVSINSFESFVNGRLPAEMLAEEPVIHSSFESAAAEVRDGLIGRSDDIPVYLHIDEQLNWQEACRLLFGTAVDHNGNPKAGDSLAFEFGGYSAGGKGPYRVSGASGYYYLFEYYPTYYTTAEQEEELDAKVPAILASLNVSGKSDLEKVNAVYSYLIKNVVYDYAHLNDPSYRRQFTSYAALINGTAVCQGISVAYYRLSLELGVDARVISSQAMNHAWNIAGLAGNYYCMDATWDLGVRNPRYYLRGSSFWLSGHTYDGYSHMGDEFSDPYFAARYNVPEDDFNCDYIVSYDANGGSGAPASQPKAEGIPLTLSEQIPVRTGYTFEGWSESPLGGVMYLPGGEYTKDANITLYAVWSPVSYFIVFDTAEGSEGSMPTVNAVYDESVILPPNGFTRTGYTFGGWSLRTGSAARTFEDCGTVINLAAEEGAYARLEAIWNPIKYTLYLDPNGAAANLRVISMKYGDSYTLPDKPFTLANHSFLGYAFAPDASEPDYIAGEKITNLSAVDGASITLFAVWKEFGYTVSFNPNGGEGTMEPVRVAFSEEFAPICGFVRPGYSFIGWKLNNAGALFAPDQVLSRLSARENGSVVLYAQWKINCYTVVFDGNGAASGKMLPLQFVYGTAKVLTANAYKRAGYDFAGWNTMPDGGGESYANRAKVNNLVEENNGVLTLYAMWKPLEYKINYRLNNGLNSPENPLTYNALQEVVFEPASRRGYTFGGWFADARFKTAFDLIPAGSSGAKTVFAKFTPVTYTVVYDPGEGTGSMPVSVMTYDKAAPLSAVKFTREGYRFTGWLCAETGAVYKDRQSVKNLLSEQDGVICLTAQWASNNYSVVFNFNGGKSTDRVSFAKQTGLNIEGRRADIPTAEPTFSGYIFTGWNTAKDSSGRHYEPGETDVNVPAAKDKAVVTLFAEWRYDITISGSIDGSVSSRTETHFFNEAFVPDSSEYHKEGYYVAGWNTDEARAASGAVQYASGRAVKNLSGKALYAVWKPCSYTIAFNSNGGTGRMGNLAMTFGRPKALTANVFKRAGFTFLGWALSPDASAVTFDNRQIVDLVPSGNKSMITLYAVWKSDTDADRGTMMYTAD